MKNNDSPHDKRVTVYIPAYNVEHYLEKCLEGVKKQTYTPERIVVVNDGSKDRSEEIARDMGAQVINHEKNLGLSTARNTAFSTIDSPFIATLDADCVPEPAWLEILMSEFDSDTVAGAGGKLIERNIEKTADLWRSRHMKQHWGDDKITSPMLLFGNNNVYRRQAVLDAGNYPTTPEFRTNNEDFYISRRLRERGMILKYNPAAVVYHYRTDTVMSVYRTNWNWFILSKIAPDSVTNMFRKMKDNVWWSVQYMKNDVGKKDWRLLPVSFGYAFSQTLFDLKFYFSPEERKRVPR